MLNALTLAHLTNDPEALTKAERTLARYGPRAGRAARVIPLMLAGLSTWHGGATQIVVLGPRDRDDTTALLARLESRYLPFALRGPGRGHETAVSGRLVAIHRRDADAGGTRNRVCLPGLRLSIAGQHAGRARVTIEREPAACELRGSVSRLYLRIYLGSLASPVVSSLVPGPWSLGRRPWPEPDFMERQE